MSYLVYPLSENCLLICGRKLSSLNLSTASLLKRQKRSNQDTRHTPLFDIVASVLSGATDVDFGEHTSRRAMPRFYTSLTLGSSGLQVDDCIVEKINISGAAVANVRFNNNAIGTLEGISSQDAIPDWLRANSIHLFSSIATTSRIRAANLLPTQKVLVTVLRKTFFQKGSGRKEEALLRGLGQLVKEATETIVGKLIKEGLLTKQRGDTGDIYVPVRSEARRAGKIIAELSLSKDPIWIFASDSNAATSTFTVCPATKLTPDRWL